MFTKFDVSTHLFNVFANVIDLQNEYASTKLKDAIMNNHQRIFGNSEKSISLILDFIETKDLDKYPLKEPILPSLEFSLETPN